MEADGRKCATLIRRIEKCVLEVTYDIDLER